MLSTWEVWHAAFAVHVLQIPLIHSCSSCAYGMQAACQDYTRTTCKQVYKTGDISKLCIAILLISVLCAAHTACISLRIRSILLVCSLHLICTCSMATSSTCAFVEVRLDCLHQRHSSKLLSRTDSQAQTSQ